MYTTVTHDASLTRNVLQRIGQSWDTRVAVRKERLDLGQYYDPAIPDFPISMVPFWDDPDFATLTQEQKLRFLAVAWVAYNEKAIYLENDIVQPACNLLFKGEFPGVSDPQVKQVIAQIQVDEQFHILMCLDICNVARTRHQVQDYVMPEPLVGVLLRRSVAAAVTPHDAAIIKLAYAAVAEMSINAYLNTVSSDMTIQPLNRINTDMHRRDEATHGIGFREIVGSIYRRMDAPAQAIFRTATGSALTDFTRPDMGSWESILMYMDVPARARILGKLAASSQGLVLRRDYGTLHALFDELGIKNDIDFAFH